MPISTVPIVPSTIPTHAPSPRLDVPMMFQREIPADIPDGPRDAREEPSRFPRTSWTDVVAIIDEFGLAWAQMIERVVGRHRLVPIVVDAPAPTVVTTVCSLPPRAALDRDDDLWASVKPLRRVGAKQRSVTVRSMHITSDPGFEHLDYDGARAPIVPFDDFSECAQHSARAQLGR